MYSKPGCHHCNSAEKWFSDRGIALEKIEVDPLIAKGIPMALGRPELEVPLVISLSEMKLIIGYRPDEYDSSASLLAANPGFHSSNAPVINGEFARPSEEVSTGEASAARYSTDMPVVYDGVDFRNYTDRTSLGR